MRFDLQQVGKAVRSVKCMLGSSKVASKGEVVHCSKKKRMEKTEKNKRLLKIQQRPQMREMPYL